MPYEITQEEIQEAAEKFFWPIIEDAKDLPDSPEASALRRKIHAFHLHINKLMADKGVQPLSGGTGAGKDPPPPPGSGG